MFVVGCSHLIAKSVEQLEKFKIRPYHILLNPIKQINLTNVITTLKQRLSKLTFN